MVNAKNVISVRVDNSIQPNSRWYSGSGIYRNVWLVSTNNIFVDHWGTFVTTPLINENAASTTVRTKVKNATGQSQEITLKTLVFDANGKKVAEVSSKKTIAANSVGEFTHNMEIMNPSLWSVEFPYQYKAVSKVESNQQATDTYETPFGIRYFNFDVDSGFSLNGKPLKILGVCDHHNDLGPLGSALNVAALEHRMKILKNMGCNGIRTSHNPPAPELLDLADRMGFIVMDEAFDCWDLGKTKYDYHIHWKKWHKRDLEDLIIRDRNHPSVILWSIGNEIPEQWHPKGSEIAVELAGIVKNLDTTRPITSACSYPSPNNHIIRSGALDVIGLNYHSNEYPDFPKMFPGKKLIATETTSALASRGSYDMPSNSIRIWPLRNNPAAMNGDYTCSSYDNCNAVWGATHEEGWRRIKENDPVSGMFIWTGFDYLGEPTPYGWPARSSYFGISDLCCFPKDVYYMYQSQWTSKPVLHLFPHWNWKENEIVDVWAYTNCDEVELFLNGKSQGTKHMNGDKLHVWWRLVFTPGTLKAVGKKDGKVILTKEIKTAGTASNIVLETDKKRIKADRMDLSYVTVKIVDSKGNMVPNADNMVQFEIAGKATIDSVANGYEIDHESFKSNKHKAFNGMCLAILKSNGERGSITLKASSNGLKSSIIQLYAI